MRRKRLFIKWLTVISTVAIMCSQALSQQVQTSLVGEIRSMYKSGIRTRPASSISVVKEKLAYARKVQDHQAVYEAFNMLFWAYSILGKTDLEKQYLDSMSLQVDKYGLDHAKIHVLNAKERYFFDIHDQEARINTLKSYVRLAQEQKDTVKIGRGLALQGDAYRSMGQYDAAIGYMGRAYDLFHAINSKRGLAQVAGQLAIYYSRKGEYEKSIEEGHKKIELATQLEDTLALIAGLSNLAAAYALKGNLADVKNIHHRRNKIIDKTEYPQSKKYSINLAITFIKQGWYDEALKELRAIEEFYLEGKDEKNLALVNHWKAIVYRGKDDYKGSAYYSKIAFEISQRIEFPKLSELSAYTLYQTYHWRGRDTEAIKWLVTSQNIKETIFREKKKEEVLRLETKFESKRKQHEIELLKANAEIERLKRNRLMLSLALSVTLGLVLLYAQYQRYKKRKREQENQLKISELERGQLTQQLEFKQRELTTHLLFIAQKNELLQGISNKLDTIIDSDSSIVTQLTKLGRHVRANLSSIDSWDQFVHAFKNIHKNFVRTMVDDYGLNANEIRLVSLIKMNFSNKEVAYLLNVSSEGIKKARYRLRKKLNMSTGESLEELILSID